MDKNKDWKNIPSLPELEMDWDYQPESASNKRAFPRIDAVSLASLFGGKQILVKIATVDEAWTVQLIDLCEGGISLAMPVSLPAGQLVKLGFYLGTRTIITRAEVRHVRASAAHIVTGLKFIGLDKESAEFIKGLYSSKVLRHTL